MEKEMSRLMGILYQINWLRRQKKWQVQYTLDNTEKLHQKDLELLIIRGLPDARDRSYIIEISGQVVDEDSGQELDSLGKLAPTIEKVKHGFGMRAPKTAS
ncbi:Glutamine--tRNA ligase [Bienertia sinuspersici]